MTELLRRHGRKKASLTEGEGTAGGLSLRHLATMAATAALTLGLAACSSGADGGRDLETASFQAGAVDDFGLQLADLPDQSDFVGAIVADEPRAALAAREVLENGGTAVDAITALYFQLSVTMPHAAGLGGGGLCLVHDPDSREVTSYNFLARRSRAGGPVAIPGNVRGFALMHAVHGSAQWSSLVTPAEVLAAQGHEVSRAFARELAPLAPALRTRPALAGIYLKPTGAPLQEGDMLVQPELAAALGQVRANGARGIYAGNMAEAFAAEARLLGTAMSVEELRAYRPSSEPAQAIKVGNQTLSLPAANTGAGRYMASLWPAAQSSDGASLLQAARNALAQAGAETNLPAIFGSTAFVVATAGGDAAACAVTMNGPFGTGRVVPGSGIVPARAPDAPGFGLAGAFLAPALITNDFNGTFFYAGAGAGGPQAPAAVLDLADSLIVRSADIKAAQATTVSDAQGKVNVVACPDGAPRDNAACVFGADPNGAGLGVLGFPPGS